MKILKILVIVMLVSGIGYLTYDFLAPRPLEVATNHLDLLVEREFGQLPALPPEAQDAFFRFAEAFGLLTMELVQVSTVEESLLSADYEYEFKYTSKFFEPIYVKTDLSLSRSGILDWKVNSIDNFPLPNYGPDTVYSRVRSEPKRGSIFDRNGQLLAGAGSNIIVGVQPDRISDPERLHQAFQETLGLSAEYMIRQYSATSVQPHWFVGLITIPEQTYREVESVLRPIPGVFFRRQESRVYPGGYATGHLTGYLGEVSVQLITERPDRDYLVGERVGSSGLELGAEGELRGNVGYHFYAEPPSGERVMLAQRPAVDGQDITLTLDLAMQKLAVDVLGERTASFVVIDAKTGDVLVLASTPGYDPNEFSLGISHNRWQELSTDPAQPMFHRALQGRYPPGSVFKVLTASAALDLGRFTPMSEFDDTGELVVEGNVIRNFEQEVFNIHPFERAVVKSINTTMAKIGLELGAAHLRDYFSRWQLDVQPQFSLPALAGQIGNPERSRVGLAWTAVGQDQVLVTPLKLASLFTVFPNQGVLPDPKIIRGQSSGETHQVLQPSTVDSMALMLEKVVTEGTGKNAAVPELRIHGKTGTAEVAGKESHAWFGGYVEDVNGQDLAFALLVEHGGTGGVIAAPLVRDFFARLMLR